MARTTHVWWHVMCLLGLLLIGSDGHSSSIPDCSSAIKAGQQCMQSVYDVRPTQFALGYTEVKCKMNDYSTKKDLQSYLQEEDNWVPAVVGPEGEYFITDHHHECRGVMACNQSTSDKKVVLDIIADWSTMKFPAFYQALVDNGLVWLYDEKGYTPMNPSLIPWNLEQMPNDPYRGFAWMVQHAGGFNKTGIFYQKFQWANFYRLQQLLYPLQPYEWPNVAEGRQLKSDLLPTNWTSCEAQPFSASCHADQGVFLLEHLSRGLELAQSAAASYLPGYGSGSSSVPNCGQRNDMLLEETLRWISTLTIDA